MNGIHKYIVTWFILFYIKALEFIPIPLIINISEVLLLLICFFYAIRFVMSNGIHGITIPILLYAFFFPIYAGISANRVFGQPIYMGVLSLRYELYILFVFYLISIGAKYNEVLKIINKINIFVALFSIIAFFVFGQTSVSIMAWIHSTNSIDTEFGESAFELKGEFLMICHSLMTISFIYYLDKLFHKHKPLDVLIFIVLIFYLLFVHKGRGPVLILGGIYLFEVMQIKSKIRKLTLLLLPSFFLVVFLSLKPEIFQVFTEILKFQDTTDSSTGARVLSITEATNYIQENPIWGVGNLSAHFGDDGFHTFFPKSFYVTDIGILGSLMMGGIIVIIIYIFIFSYLIKNYKEYTGDCKTVLKCYVAFFVIRMFTMGDPLILHVCLSFAFLYFPLIKPSSYKICKRAISK